MDFSAFISDFENLPKQVQKQVVDYIEFLTSKYSPKKQNKLNFKFDWENGLAELKDKYTSVDLQHLANKLR